MRDMRLTGEKYPMIIQNTETSIRKFFTGRSSDEDCVQRDRRCWIPEPVSYREICIVMAQIGAVRTVWRSSFKGDMAWENACLPRRGSFSDTDGTHACDAEHCALLTRIASERFAVLHYMATAVLWKNEQCYCYQK